MKDTIMLKSTIELLDQAKGADSDELLAKKVGVTRSSISNWRRLKHVGADCAVKLARIAGIDPKDALAICAAESIQDEEIKRSVFTHLQNGFVKIGMYPALILGSAIARLYLMSNGRGNRRAAFERRKHDRQDHSDRRRNGYTSFALGNTAH